jgi:triosephosphate isomerase
MENLSLNSRKFIVGGNWKCNGSVESINKLVNEVVNPIEIDETKVEVVISPVNIHIGTVKAVINPSVKVACQNISAQGFGAYTGETSAEHVKDFGLEWVLIGHSERRVLYGETNEIVATKTKCAQAQGLNAIVCVGEMLEERENGTTNDVLKVQLDAFKDSVSDWSKIVIAYEPVWAIGTGKTATPEIAEETHQYIRSWFNDCVSAEVAQSIRIQYGGSVNAKNAADLIVQTNIDGFLVGSASLKPDFATIIDICQK